MMLGTYHFHTLALPTTSHPARPGLNHHLIFIRYLLPASGRRSAEYWVPGGRDESLSSKTSFAQYFFFTFLSTKPKK